MLSIQQLAAHGFAYLKCSKGSDAGVFLGMGSLSGKPLRVVDFVCKSCLTSRSCP